MANVNQEAVTVAVEAIVVTITITNRLKRSKFPLLTTTLHPRMPNSINRISLRRLSLQDLHYLKLKERLIVPLQRPMEWKVVIFPVLHLAMLPLLYMTRPLPSSTTYQARCVIGKKTPGTRPVAVNGVGKKKRRIWRLSDKVASIVDIVAEVVAADEATVDEAEATIVAMEVDAVEVVSAMDELLLSLREFHPPHK